MVEETGEPSGTQQNQKQEGLSEKAKALEKNEKDAKDLLKKLKKNWKLMKKVLNALVIYSDELAALADAGTKGEEAAHGVADGLDGIIGTMTKGALNIPENLVNAFEKINDRLEDIRTRKALKKAIEEAQPAINTIIMIIALNLNDLEKINNSAGRALRILQRNTNQTMLNYHDVLIESQQTIFKILTGILHYKRGGPRAPYYLKDVVKLDKILAGIGEEKITIEDIEAREKHWLTQHQKINREINNINPRYQAYKTREEKINKLTLTGSLILRKGIIAIHEYGKAHMKLKKTLGKKQRMSLVGFASVVQDVVDAYKGGK
jgi:DNA repair exonuclease SbcCD ATPase subunit